MEQPALLPRGRAAGLVCKLQKSLYGLKQSPRAWFVKFIRVIQQFGMIRCEAGDVSDRWSTSGYCVLI
jgi:hypothetical protein